MYHLLLKRPLLKGAKSKEAKCLGKYIAHSRYKQDYNCNDKENIANILQIYFCFFFGIGYRHTASIV